jgi:hypothetical protein
MKEGSDSLEETRGKIWATSSRRTKNGWRLGVYVYPGNLPSLTARRTEDRVRAALRDLGADPDPEETSRRALMWQQP